MRKKAFFTGGLLVLMLLLSNTAFASNLQLNTEEVNKIKTEINAGKPVKDVLKEHNITMDDIRSTLAETGMGKSHHKLSNTQIAFIAKKLGLNTNDVQTEIAAGKSLPEILKAHNLTKEQIRSAVAEQTPVGKPPLRKERTPKRPVSNKAPQ